MARPDVARLALALLLACSAACSCRAEQTPSGDAHRSSSLSVLAYALPWTSHTFDILRIGVEMVRRNHTYTAVLGAHLQPRAEAYLQRHFDSGVIPEKMQVRGGALAAAWCRRPRPPGRARPLPAPLPDGRPA
jgi:hypothetical protein